MFEKLQILFLTGQITKIKIIKKTSKTEAICLFTKIRYFYFQKKEKFNKKIKLILISQTDKFTSFCFLLFVIALVCLHLFINLFDFFFSSQKRAKISGLNLQFFAVFFLLRLSLPNVRKWNYSTLCV